LRVTRPHSFPIEEQFQQEDHETIETALLSNLPNGQ
jgi:hypothetical protein